MTNWDSVKKGEPNDLILWPNNRLYQTGAGLTQPKIKGLDHIQEGVQIKIGYAVSKLSLKYNQCICYIKSGHVSKVNFWHVAQFP